ncbi:MAG: outer membrane lipoprotein carrier protein LolA [Kofleriaceae bacterium]|nr:outer membrane lipoprotein carrier protein LolA [Kofleriaceae bacterium]
MPPAQPAAPVRAPLLHVVSTPLVGAPGATAAAPTATAPATAITADQAVDKIQAFYATIQQVTAQFRQSVTYDMLGGAPKNSDGKVWIQKPGKMRWDYLEKKKGQVVVKKSFISNGSYLYMVEHDNKQVVKKNLERDLMPVAVSFLYGKGDLKNEFNAQLDTSGKYGTKEDVVLKLTPKQPSAQYKALYLVASTKDFHVSQSIIVDSSNNVNQFRFFAPDFKTPIDGKKTFEFDERSVKNYRIVDADQQQQGAGSGAGAPAPLKPATPPAK